MVTAYSNFAVDSYQYGVIDYLLKPFSFDRFSMAVAKVYERHQSHGGTNKRNIDNEIDAVYLKADRRKHMQVELQNIQYIKGAANFSVVFMRNNDEIIVSDRLNKLAEKLPLKRFLRIHRSFIINMDHVEYVDGSKVKLKGIDNHFTIGPAYVHGIQEHIQ
jgi:DNA-binding LytR/AlgR family response regulator